MHFKSAERPPKATIEIGSSTYKIMAPNVEQAEKFALLYEENKGNSVVLMKLMKEYISELGKIPMDEINKLDHELFGDLFKYVTEPQKKS